MSAQNSNKQRNIIILLSLLLLASVVGNFYLFKQEAKAEVIIEASAEEINTLIAKKVELGVSLEKTALELEKYKGISAGLDSLINEGNAKIKSLEKRIAGLNKNAKDSKTLTAELQKEIVKLGALKDEYLEKIDNLLMQNEKLKLEKLALNNTVNTLQTEVKGLEGKVVVGEQLLADNINISTLKKNLAGKFTNTALAKKTKKIDACFDLIVNKLAKPGNYTVYMRIFSPEGAPFYDEETGSGTFKHPDLKIQTKYTLKQEIAYKNEKQNVCILWEAPATYKAGNYIVELFTDNYKIGVASFVLR